MILRSLLLSVLLGGILAACGGQNEAPEVGASQEAKRSTTLAASANPSVALAGKRADFKLTAITGADYEYTNTSTGVATRIPATSRARFVDYTVGMDLEGNAGKVYRLYQAAFNRVPDVRGLSYWIEAMDTGYSLGAIAVEFASSAEFKAVYGTAPANVDVVSRFYQNVLQRSGEPAGIAFWTNALQNGSATVPEVLAGFSESAENKAGVLPAISNGIAFRESSYPYVTIAHAGTSKSVVLGTPVSLDGSESMGASDRSLVYSWSITARPAGSAAQLVNATAVRPSITPDMIGVYTLSLNVSDGSSSVDATVSIRTVAPMLEFAPLDVRYSIGLDKLVIVSTNPNAVKIIDPFTSTMKSVALPVPVKSFNLSPDGKLASILHESVASTIDLETGTVVKSFATGGSHTDVFITNTAVTYLIGQSGGQWVRPSVVYFDGRTGQDVTKPETTYMGSFYGTQFGVFAASKNKVFLMSQGLSPADIDYFTLDPLTNAVVAAGDSPYHGDYSMRTPLYLSSTEDILFTSSGNYFYTSNLRYAGTFSLGGTLLSLSNSARNDETLVIASPSTSYRNGDKTEYPAEYQRFTGSLFFPDARYKFPMIGGKQSYGRKIFHSADGRRVALVQTGSAIDNGPDVRYYIVVL